MRTGPSIRHAADADLPVIRRLFNVLIPTTTVAWRDHLADEDEIAEWFADQQHQDYPVLVAEVDGEVVGYTCWSRFRGGPRFPGYRHTVELTVHVDGAHQGAGIGTALLERLIDEASRRDVHVLVAGIDADNVGSLALHRRLGFEQVARMPEVGRKHGRWLDLVLVQRIIEPAGASAAERSAPGIIEPTG